MNKNFNKNFEKMKYRSPPGWVIFQTRASRIGAWSAKVMALEEKRGFAFCSSRDKILFREASYYPSSTLVSDIASMREIRTFQSTGPVWFWNLSMNYDIQIDPDQRFKYKIGYRSTVILTWNLITTFRGIKMVHGSISVYSGIIGAIKITSQ